MGSLRLTLAVLAAFVVAAPAHAAYPGSNGKIAFSRGGHIWTMNADGSGATQIAAAAEDPEWSPDGTRIAFVRGSPGSRRVWTMNADGSGQEEYPVFLPGPFHDPGEVYAPTWSPDGRELAYVLSWYDEENCFCQMWETRNSPSLWALDGAQWSPVGTHLGLSETDETEAVIRIPVAAGFSGNVIGNGTLRDYGPAWSPDGAKVVYISRRGDVTVCDGAQPTCQHEVQIANADNTGITRLTNNGAAEYEVEWSPDGAKLVYSGVEPGCSSGCNADLHTMNPDGTGRVRITDTAAAESSPDWQPVVTPSTGQGFPRPKGATPLRASLVPAYAACGTPNRVHGPPLAYGSCNPPTQRSSNLTLGTPDANGAAVNMSGQVKLSTLGGHPVPADDADVRITVTIADVRCRIFVASMCSTQGNTHPMPDYIGRLTGRVSLRLTDRYNLPSPAGRGAGTVSDTTFDFRPECVPTTADPATGSTCSLDTALSALRPGLVVEGRRSIWQLGEVQIFDGGAGGSAAPGSGAAIFLTQGVFIP